MIFVVAKWTIRPVRSDEWLALTDDFTQAARNEANLFFEWSRSADNPHQFVLVETFASREPGQAHVNSEHFAPRWRGCLTWSQRIRRSSCPGAAGWLEPDERGVPARSNRGEQFLVESVAEPADVLSRGGWLQNIGNHRRWHRSAAQTDVAAMQSVRVKTWQPCPYPVRIVDSTQQLLRKPLIAPTPLLRRMKSRLVLAKCRVRACPRSRCRAPRAPAARCPSASSSKPIPGGRISRVEGRCGA
jgi:quinol monooxygenase YgiN